jgi:hypothetical protein
VSRAFVPEPRPIVLGVAAWIALAGWKLMVSPIAFAIAHMRGGEPPFELSPTASAIAALLGYVAIVAPGYVTARAAARAPFANAATLGLIIFVVSTLVELAAGAALGVSAPFDAEEALVDVSVFFVATLIGGAIAYWHMRSRGAERWGARVLSLRAATILLVVALIPYVLLAAAFRP